MPRWSALAVAGTLAAGCGIDLPPPQSLAGSTTDPTRALRIRGHARAANRAPLGNTEISFKLSAFGSELFLKPDGSCRTDARMPGSASTVAATDPSAVFDFNAGLPEFVSAASSRCFLQKPLGQLDALKVEASIEANPLSCAALCERPPQGAPTDCLAQCLDGNRRILATQFLSSTHLLLLEAESAGGIATADLELEFASLGPPLSPLRGPDLAVDGAAVQASARISVETFGPDDCAVVERCLPGPGIRKLLRFDGTILNLGDTDFVLGAPESNSLFVHSACHNHYHLQDVMLYELLTVDGRLPVQVNGADVIGRKQGFCLEDSAPVAGSNPGKFNFDFQGITSGWSDIYYSDLDCQWIDVTGVPPGDYVLRVTVNPSGRYSETDPTNNSADARVRITGQ